MCIFSKMLSRYITVQILNMSLRLSNIEMFNLYWYCFCWYTKLFVYSFVSLLKQLLVWHSPWCAGHYRLLVSRKRFWNSEEFMTIYWRGLISVIHINMVNSIRWMFTDLINTNHRSYFVIKMSNTPYCCWIESATYITL